MSACSLKSLNALTLTLASLMMSLMMCVMMSACTPSPPPQAQARRVISLAPSLTEWVFALGAEAQLVGRSERCDQPAAALKIKSVGGLFPHDLELLLSPQPTHALMIDGHAQLKAQLERFGVAVHTLQPHSLEEHWGVARELGRLLEREGEAEALIQRQSAHLKARLKALPPLTSPPRVLIEVWPKPLSVAGAESFMGDLVRVAGGEPTPTGLGAWPQLTPELLMTLNPEVVLVSSEARAQQLLSPSAPKAWRSLKAVREGRVYAREGQLERPGPRLVGEVVWLAERLREGR